MAAVNYAAPPPAPPLQTGSGTGANAQAYTGGIPGTPPMGACPPNQVPDGKGGCRLVQTAGAPGPGGPGGTGSTGGTTTGTGPLPAPVTKPAGTPAGTAAGTAGAPAGAPAGTAAGNTGQAGTLPSGPTNQATNARGISAGTAAQWAHDNIDSTIPIEQWNAWQSKFDPACPPDTPYRAERQGANNACVEKPPDCPTLEGVGPTTAFGHDQCVPTSDPRIQAAWGTGGAGAGAGGAGSWGGGPGGPGGGWGLSEEEKGYLTAITSLANQMRTQGESLFNAGMPAYLSTAEHYKAASGAYGRAGVQNAVAPAAEHISDTYKGARAQTRELRGADKVAATAELARGEAGDIGRLGQQAQEASVAGLQSTANTGLSTGLATEAQAAGLYAGAEQAMQGSRLTEEGYGNQQTITKMQTESAWNIASLQANVSREALAQESALGWARIQQGGAQFAQTLALQQKSFDEMIREFNISQSNQKSASNSAFLGGVIGAGASIAVVV